MSNLTINISAGDLQESSYDPIPAGTYDATVYAVEVVEVKNGENAGKPQYKIQFRLSTEYENRRLFTYVPLYTGKAFWKTQAFFEALGYEMNDGKFTVPTPAELGGKAIRLKTTIVQGLNGDENNVAGFSKAVKVDAASLLLGAGAKAVEGETW